YYLTKIRTSLLNQYYLFYDKSEDQSMIAGLIFGQRQALPQEIEEAYRNTGVMHVLAVSGLHVVLLYKVLHTVLKFITRNRWVHFVIVGLFLIAFAMLSGLSGRSEEHTSELQSRENLVCRLLLEKKKKQKD